MNNVIELNAFFYKGEIKVGILEVAKAIRVFCTKDMTHKKLQKLSYYVYAWNIALKGKIDINTEFEAWVHGPVSPELYREFKGMYSISPIYDIPKDIEKNSDLKEIIEQIVRIYGELNGDELEALTHSEKPWQEARKGLQPWEASKNKINTNLIEEYYYAQLEMAKEENV